MLLHKFVQLVPNETPVQRLVYSMEARDLPPLEEESASPGGRRWIYWTIAGLATVICGAALWWVLNANEPSNKFGVANFIKARTQSLANGRNSSEMPAPIVIQLSPEMIRVTAIALGHPRLAVINGDTVAEGDNVRLKVPNGPISLTLRVVRIADGWIDLTDGKQMFSARLTIPSPPKATKPL
jgi:hypothetical protein